MPRPPKLPDNPKNLTGAAIRRLRMGLKRRVTQEDLAGRLAAQGLLLNQAQIAKIESGRRAVSDFELVALSRALRIPVHVIIDNALKHGGRKA